MKIIAYLKSECERCKEVCSVMEKYALNYESRDVAQSDKYAEMIRKSGQRIAPCVEIDGAMLIDTSGQELEKYLLGKNLVKSIINEMDTSLDDE